jgi:hypothetical protein
MKNGFQLLFIVLISLLIISGEQFAQGTKYCKMLGKTFKEAKKTYGAPTFQNLDDVNMQWVFYQLGNDKITFVSNEKNIFQVQVEITCDSKNDSQSKMGEFLKDCVANSMKIDTLNEGNFKIAGNGIQIDLYNWENLSRNAAGFKYKALLTEPKKEN